MKELLFEIIREAQTGRVIIDNEVWPICFNTLLKDHEQYQSFITNENFPILILEDLEEFLSLLAQYIKLEISLNRRHPMIVTDKERNLKKFLISYLFVNSTTEEFLNPCLMLKQRIAFLENNLLKNLDQTFTLEIIPNSKIHLTSKVDSILMETPNKLEISITNDTEQYLLPSISYAISGDTCYIYSILNPKQEISTTYQKKIKRLLYKINEFVPEEELQVSPSAVLSLAIFLKILRLHNITKIKAVPYLPLRYLSRDFIAKDNSVLHERNDSIQTNATNKFIDTFRRLNHHQMINIKSYPYEQDECLNILVNNCEPNNNLFLNQISKKITK